MNPCSRPQVSQEARKALGPVAAAESNWCPGGTVIPWPGEKVGLAAGLLDSTVVGRWHPAWLAAQHRFSAVSWSDPGVASRALSFLHATLVFEPSLTAQDLQHI